MHDSPMAKAPSSLASILLAVFAVLLVAPLGQASDAPAQPAIRLIVRGDDMGSARAANEAILRVEGPGRANLGATPRARP